MVQEIRQITLETDELIKALEVYREKNPAFMLEGSIMALGAAGHQTLKVTINAVGGIRDVEYKFSELLPPITAFCVAHCIPLPWQSHKSIEILDSIVILKISVNHIPPEKINQKALSLTTRHK